MDNNRDTDFVDSGGGGRTAYGSRRRHGNNADYDSAREVNNEACGELALGNFIFQITSEIGQNRSSNF